MASARCSRFGNGGRWLRCLSLILSGVVFLAPRLTASELSEAAAWLQSYLQIDSTTPAGEATAAAYLAGLLQGEGIATELLVSADGRTSLYARLAADRPVTGGGVVLLHHLDVVAPGAGWTMEPFGGRVAAGRLWGRGALDSKSLGIAQLAAVIDLARSHVPRSRDLILLAVADEENGGTRGTGWLVDKYPERFRGLSGVINEGGSARQVNGRLLWWEVEVAQKRPLWIEVTARGRGGHAAGLNPHSAVHQLVTGLAKLVDLAPELRVTAAARQFLSALAPLHSPALAAIFTHIDEHVGGDNPGAGLLPGMASLFMDTVQVTVLEGSQQINVVAATARARVDVRLLPDTDSDAFLARVRNALGPDVDVQVLLSAPPGQTSPTDSPIYSALNDVLGLDAPVVPALKPGFTDSRWFRERGIPAYGMTPFALEPSDLAGIHGPDEHLPLAELDRGVERLRRVLRALVAGH
jgi:acetylornithine deacetylase/succinyl-diaminopimelate desuccinylase-like protein